MTKAIKKIELFNWIEEKINDAIYELENDRFEPSERGAGTAPTQSAVNAFADIVWQIGEKINQSGLSVQEIKTPVSIEEVLFDINASQEQNIADGFDCLEEVDSFVRDNGETKYRYSNTVYKHKPSGKFICVECQCGVGQWEGLISSINAYEVTKKEKVTYEWS